MNLDNIKVGNVYKNYKELCAALGEKVKTGNSKIYQLIDFKRYFDYNQPSRAFTITKVYDSPLEKKDGRKIGNNVLPFIDEMELLLINLLLNVEGNEMTISNSKMFLMLSMVNPNYLHYVNNKEQLSRLNDMDIGFIIDFYDVTNSTFRSAINTVTKRLENKKLVIHEKVIMVCFVDTPVKKTVTGHIKINELYNYKEEDKSYTYKNVKPKEVFREATSEERELIIKIENHIMTNKYGYKNIQDLILAGKGSAFYSDVSRLLFKELNIKMAYKAHRYTFNIKNLNNEMVELLNKYEISEIKKQINNKVMIRLDEKSNERYEAALNELLRTDTTKPRIITRSDESYIDNINHLSSNLIDSDNVDGLKEDDELESLYINQY